MMTKQPLLVFTVAFLAVVSEGFLTTRSSVSRSVPRPSTAFLPRLVLGTEDPFRLRSTEKPEEDSSAAVVEALKDDDDALDPMEGLDSETKKAMAKAKRAQELREQEVFMKRSTGKHECTNCGWEYDETKGDSMMIGGQIQPGTPFAELPSNYRCPVCRSSKDAFKEIVEEIPGFEVNQSYGFGTNSWTAEQKNLAVFGGLGIFFILFLSGYAMS